MPAVGPTSPGTLVVARPAAGMGIGEVGRASALSTAQPRPSVSPLAGGSAASVGVSEWKAGVWGSGTVSLRRFADRPRWKRSPSTRVRIISPCSAISGKVDRYTRRGNGSPRNQRSFWSTSRTSSRSVRAISRRGARKAKTSGTGSSGSQRRKYSSAGRSVPAEPELEAIGPMPPSVAMISACRNFGNMPPTPQPGPRSSSPDSTLPPYVPRAIARGDDPIPRGTPSISREASRVPSSRSGRIRPPGHTNLPAPSRGMPAILPVSRAIRQGSAAPFPLT